MATIRKTKSKTWVAEVRKQGQRKAKTFATKLAAQKWALQLEQQLTPGMLVLGKTLSDTLIRYRNEVSPEKKSYKNECNRINKLTRHVLSGYELGDIQQKHIYEWMYGELKRIKSSSVNRDLNLLSAVFEQAKRWGWIEANPVRGIKRPRNPRPRERRISEVEIKLILDALQFDGVHVYDQRHELAVAFLIALETAMRQGEIWKLKWRDVYLDRRFVRLHDTKNGTRRDVPLSPEAVRLFLLLKGNSEEWVMVCNQASSATIYRRAVKLAGISGLTFHDARHEALTRLARKLDILDLARVSGHRDPRSLMIYYNPTAEEIAGRLV